MDATASGKETRLERSAVKWQDGFKVEANGDDIDAVRKDAEGLYAYAACATRPATPPQEK